jgi:hypothetical protein
MNEWSVLRSQRVIVKTRSHDSHQSSLHQDLISRPVGAGCICLLGYQQGSGFCMLYPLTFLCILLLFPDLFGKDRENHKGTNALSL